ncbi:putative DNA-binding protein [Streptomyces sp. NBRC 110611]|uniref:hypothetical protein n=1 Tax=Streptomyces sp. NBRC 110611 TaxID=1621259 RepID=UPI000835B9C7|nr:hypothetical protein [Streptomyces sp. NBRC 110611]GAU71437.1 putative DNA-binding protein [Streptomyces sp. NBRC 110611]
MASRAQLVDCPALPALPDGEYGVPNPHDSSVMTLWRIDRGKLSAWPPGERWAPRPPAGTRDMPHEEHRARRDAFYRETYWPWKAAVVEEIARAPRICAALFWSDSSVAAILAAEDAPPP